MTHTNNDVFFWLHLVNAAGDAGFIVPPDFPLIEELEQEGYLSSADNQFDVGRQ